MAPRKSATEAVKKELEKKEAVPIPTEKKNRCDFKDWDEYWSYKGPKG